MLITRETPLREKSIVLIGFMGVGKTTVGEIVAKRLYRSFIDIDQVIERDFGMPTTEIFKKYGEEKFRDYEKNTIVSYCRQRLKVISLGGGAFMNDEVRKVCLSNCIVFYLDVAWEEWKKRLHILVDSRPVLQNRDIEDIQKLFYERQGIYAVNHSKLTVDERSAEEVADYIVDSLKLSWEIHDPQ